MLKLGTRSWERGCERGDEKEIRGGGDDRNPIENGRVTVKVR